MSMLRDELIIFLTILELTKIIDRLKFVEYTITLEIR